MTLGANIRYLTYLTNIFQFWNEKRKGEFHFIREIVTMGEVLLSNSRHFLDLSNECQKIALEKIDK